VGLTYSDNALFGKDDSSAVPSGGSLRSHTDRIAFLVPGDACRRGTAFGYEPVRLKFWQQKKLRTVTGAVICPKGSHANTRPGHVAAQSQRREASIRPSEFGFLQFGRCGKIPVLMPP